MGRRDLGYVSATHARWLTGEDGRPWREHDATLVFADVSGFTALSERLARRGKIGAEETTDVVNDVFGGLLAATLRSGGELLKFGGDAVLAHFEGEGHEPRGAAAALAMQDAMRGLRRLQDRGRPGDPPALGRGGLGPAAPLPGRHGPRELVVAGPLATEVIALESAASAGQVLAGAGTLAALPAGSRRRGDRPGRLLRGVAGAARGGPARRARRLRPALGAARPPARPRARGRRASLRRRGASSSAAGIGAVLEREGPEAVAAALRPDRRRRRGVPAATTA